VLIGVSHFPESPELADLPAVRENVAGLWRRLTDDATGVLGPGHCEVTDPEGSTADIGRAISRAAAEASDMLLIYYAGHGLVDDRGRLYLATNATRADAPKYSALGVDLLREDLGGSGAAARVLILDCCFSGRAIEVMTGEEGLLDGQLSIAGTYTMTSTTANAPSYAHDPMALPRPQPSSSAVPADDATATPQAQSHRTRRPQCRPSRPGRRRSGVNPR
jgi:hypothetical protein